MKWIMLEIAEELERAIAKFPAWPTDPVHAAAVVAEECGELVKAVLEAVYEPSKRSKRNIRVEALQAAAMCVRMIASMEQYEWVRAKQHLPNPAAARGGRQ